MYAFSSIVIFKNHIIIPINILKSIRIVKTDAFCYKRKPYSTI